MAWTAHGRPLYQNVEHATTTVPLIGYETHAAAGRRRWNNTRWSSDGPGQPGYHDHGLGGAIPCGMARIVMEDSKCLHVKIVRSWGIHYL